MNKPAVWILGGAKGINRMIVTRLIAAGYKVYLSCHVSLASAEDLFRSLQVSAQDLELVEGDSTQAPDVADMARRVLGAEARLWALVHTTGPFNFDPSPVRDTPDELWERMLRGNLLSFVYSTRHVLPVMRDQRKGRIVAFGFDRVDQAPAWPGHAAYAAAKVGLLSLIRTLAKEEYARGITVNMVCPGDIRHPYKEAAICQAMAKGEIRAATGEDIARVVEFLLHPDSDHITGSVIQVTGGRHL